MGTLKCTLQARLVVVERHLFGDFELQPIGRDVVSLHGLDHPIPQVRGTELLREEINGDLAISATCVE